MSPIVKRLLIASTLIGLCVVGWFTYRHLNPELAIEVTQAELQAKLNGQFPLRKCAPLQLACLDVRTPKITLKEGGDRIDVALAISVKAAGEEYPARASLSSKLRYAPAEGAVYLDDVELTEFDAGGKLGDFESMIRSYGSGVISAALSDTPVYTLNDAGKEALAKKVVRDVRVENGKVRIVVLSASK
ncbi:MAG: DUF1439 domain-containing protein [Betaproteobacteria bacterium]|nr:MAG: DUF1439 domain-containing protein [Betaproteobacteria bacterium]